MGFSIDGEREGQNNRITVESLRSSPPPPSGMNRLVNRSTSPCASGFGPKTTFPHCRHYPLDHTHLYAHIEGRFYGFDVQSKRQRDTR